MAKKKTTTAKTKHILGAHMSIAGGVSRAIELGRDTGCDAVQLFTKSNNQWKSKPIEPVEIQKFKSLAKDTAVRPVASHDAYLINLSAPDADILEKSIAAFIDEIERAAMLDIPYLVFHPGSHKDTGETEGIKRIAESISHCVKQISTKNPPMLLLELTAGQGSNIGYKFEHMRAIIDLVKCPDLMGICADTCHMFAAGYDIKSKKGYEQTWNEFDKIIGLDRLKMFHINDSKKGLGSRVDRHEHIGKGELGDESFKLLMNDDRFAGLPMILETPKSDDCHEDKINLDRLRSLIQGAGS